MMKRIFTHLTAAIMLFTFLAVPMGMRGQTRSVTYEPATSISAGDVVLLVAEGNNYKKELSGFSTTSTIYGTVADYTTAPAGVYPLTVVAGNSSGSFAFKNSENKYLSWSSGNSLQLSETLNNSSSWTFNYSYTVTTLTNVGTTSRQIKYNSSSPRFACYTSAQQSIKLYKQVTSSLLDSDLALTGAPVELSFDLYNNASAQTVSFTTSSTGAITVSQSDYITATVDANNITITVTPVAVTNGTQTITVSQEADDTYDAGSVTFTVEVTDSTPATTVTIDDSGITNTDVYFSTAAGSLSATVTSDDSPVSGATVTWSGDNDDVATIASDGTVTLVGVGTVTFTATYAGASGQYVGSSATYEMTVTSSAPYVQPTTIEIIPNYTFWGKTGQFSGSTFDELDGSQDNVSLHWTRGSGSTYANLTAMRFYKDNELTFTAPEGYEITSIELTVSGTYNDLTFDPTGYDNTTTTWTGSSQTVTMSRPSNASSYATISKFTITLASSGSAVTTTTTINVPDNFNTDIYQGTTAGTLTATVKDNENNTISGATVTWESSNTDVATIDAYGEVTLVAVGTTTITASYAGVEDEYRPSTGTYELTVTDSNAPGTENHPYTVAQAIAATPSSGTTANVYIHGIVSRFHNTSIMGDGTNYRYYISDDGTTSNELLVYKGKGLNDEPFTDENDLLVGDEVTICGGLTMYSNTPEIAANNYLVSLTHKPSITLEDYTIEVPYSGGDGTMTVQYENIDEIDADIQFYYYEGEQLTETDSEYYEDWFVALKDDDNNVEYTVDPNLGTARSAYFKVYALVGEDFVYSGLITVTQAAAPQPIITVTPSTVNATAAETDGTLDLSYENLTITDMTSFSIQYYDFTGAELNDAPDWIEVLVAEQDPNIGDGYVVSYYMVENEGADVRTAYFKVRANSSNQEMVYSDIVTVTQAANVVTYSLASEIVSGKHYIITSGTDGSVKAMGSQSTNNRYAVSVTVTDGVIPKTEGVYEVVIIGPDVEGYYTLYDVTNEKYLYAAGTSSSNYLKSQNDIDDRARWTITFNDDAAVINSITTETNRTLMRYNSGSNCFSCYGSGQNAIYLFAKDNELTVSYEKGIDSYGNSLNGGYYLIASPVGQVTPTESNEFLTNNYDLYAFDQSEDAEWRNYEAGSFNLISGRGYLYANNGENVTLTFEGYPYVGNGQVMLAYDGDAEFAGWNLVGNPFNATAYLENNRPFYVLDETGTELIESSGSIGVMQGLFVKATATGDNVTFTTSAPQTLTSGIHANLSSGSRLIDRATICFGEGSQLPKFQLNPDNTKLYITEGNIDYAVVNSNSKGEMPINFKASKNSTYTLSINAENVEMTYLHLIDNLTGANVDLLANPSYTFEATTNDYTSRFRLVFKANMDVEENTTTETFAYYNGSAWVISNTGDATLQVIDMMGRVLRSEQISGNTTVNINEIAGVYMLRLVNGENVMVQKVVVR